MFIYDANDHPAGGTFGVFDRGPGGRTVGGNNDVLVHTRAMGVNRNLRRALGPACAIDRLANDQAPTLEAGMLSSRHQIAFNAGQEHVNKF
jgi:hypothetical protein